MELQKMIASPLYWTKICFCFGGRFRSSPPPVPRSVTPDPGGRSASGAMCNQCIPPASQKLTASEPLTTFGLNSGHLRPVRICLKVPLLRPAEAQTGSRKGPSSKMLTNLVLCKLVLLVSGLPIRPLRSWFSRFLPPECLRARTISNIVLCWR